MSRWRILSVLSTLGLIFSLVPVVALPALGQPTGVMINEIRIDQPSTDNDEYFELVGGAGAALDGLTYVVIGDGTGGSGVIEAVVDLTGSSIGASGFFVAAETTFTIGSADLTTTLNFENSDNVTHLLVEGFTGESGDDLDIDDDGTLDTTPWTSVVDSVALIETVGSGDLVYSATTVGPDGSFVPAHVYRCASWEIGAFDSAGGDDTPGAVNACAAAPPAVTLSEIRIDQPSTDNDEYFELAGAAGTALDGLSYLVIGDGTGGSGVVEAVVDLTGTSIGGSGFFVAAESTFTLGTADLTTSLNFENSDNVTHLLVFEFTGASGDDLDTNDDGAFDATPWSAVVDSVALIETVGSGDLVYSTATVGPDGSFVPGHAYQCASWEIGGFTLGTDDTPGAANPCTAEPPAVALSEIRIDQPSTDNDEYFELAGTAGTALDGLTYLVIGDGTGGSGVVEAVVDLGGQTIPASGFFVAAESTFSIGTADLTTNLNFENSDNVTHLLVQGFTGANGDDLDADDDGALDTTPWTAIVDSVALIETVGSGDLVYSSTTVGPDGSFVPGHVYVCEGWQIGGFSLGTNDTPGGDNCAPPDPLGACGDPATLISIIQGSGMASPEVGNTHVIEGVVVGDFQTGLGGFFVQEEDVEQDGDPATSEGIFVFGSSIDVSEGEVVRVIGPVSEFFDHTQLTMNDALSCATGATVTPATPTLPVADLGDWEAWEGMAIHIVQELTVSDNFNLGRFGEVVLSVDGRLENPTAVALPGAPAAAVSDLNQRRSIQMDDGTTAQNPIPVPPYFAPDGTLRAGDTAPGLTGVLGYSFGAYEVHPTVTPTFTRDNPRPVAPPEVGGTLTVAAYNVLNYFTTIDDGTPICGPLADQGCRGADTADEFDKQRTKIIDAISTLDADVVGLMEIENNASASTADLVAGLNDAVGAGTYDFIDTGTVGADAIKVAVIYQPSMVTPVGAYAVLDNSVDSTFNDDKNRPVVAQTFMENSTGEVFTVAVNHLKSKGSPCDDVGDPNAGDFQGNCNGVRTAAAEAMADWLATDPTGSGSDRNLIIGDLNAYVNEDPIMALKAAGYSDLVAHFGGPDDYSFVFFGERGYLDYGMASPAMHDRITGAAFWHINADEPRALDYNNFNQPELYQPDEFRSSDHDPVVIGVKLADARGDKEAVLDGLLELYPTGDKQVDNQLADIIAKVTASLDPAYWTGDNTLDPATGEDVFALESTAIRKLTSIASAGGTASAEAGDLAAALVDVDRVIAQVALVNADGLSVTKTARAHDLMAEAAAQTAAGEYATAATTYKRVWLLVQSG